MKLEVMIRDINTTSRSHPYLYRLPEPKIHVQLQYKNGDPSSPECLATSLHKKAAWQYTNTKHRDFASR